MASMLGMHLVSLLFLVLTAASLALGQEFWLDEGKPAGQFVGNVITGVLPQYLTQKGIALTSAQISELRYTLFATGNPTATNFTVDEVSGNITTTVVLDRERLCPADQYCVIGLDIAAHSTESVNILRVAVKVRDTNDHTPMFPDNQIHIGIPESSKIGSYFLLASASDADYGFNGIQAYRLLSTTDKFELVTTRTPEGQLDIGITTLAQLDREQADTYSLRIRVSDGGNPQKSSTATLVITVTDSNDHPPEFLKSSYTGWIKENSDVGTPVVKLFARDNDTGLNGQVRYQFSLRTLVRSRELFQINGTSGEISVKGAIDYEELSTHRLLVEAKDLGRQPQASHTTVIVYVDDENDNYPQLNLNFLTKTDYALVKEHVSVGQFVALLSVSDPDQAANGVTDCTLDSNLLRLQNLFDNEFQVILNSTLDREITDEYNVTVTCADHGTPSLSASTIFRLLVEDINDNPPKFEQTHYFKSIMENNERGASIIKISATDDDIGDNGDIIYGLQGRVVNMIDIDRRTGLITAKQKFDREAIQTVNFVVTARDNGIPNFMATASVLITILDQNDVVPVFNLTAYVFDVPENLLSNYTIVRLRADDFDTGPAGKVRFSLLSVKGGPGRFALAANKKDVVVMPSLDREAADKYLLTILATDRGNPRLSSSTILTVRVTDVNDNSPIVSFPDDQNNTVRVNSTAKLNTRIAIMEASDPDSEENADISFAIERQNSGRLFDIDSQSGEIWLRKPLAISKSVTLGLLIAVKDNGTPQRVTLKWLYVNVTYINTTALLDLSNRDGDSNSQDSDKLAIIIAVVVVTVVACILIISVICIVLRRRRGRRCQGETGDDKDKEGYADIVVDRTAESRSRDLKWLARNRGDRISHQNCDTIVMANQGALMSQLHGPGTKDDGSVSTDQAGSSFDRASSLSFLWVDTRKSRELDSGVTQAVQRPFDTLVGERSSKNELSDVARHPGGQRNPDDAVSDVSEASGTSDSGRGGSDEGSARGHCSLEEQDNVVHSPNAPHEAVDGDYVDMSGLLQQSQDDRPIHENWNQIRVNPRPHSYDKRPHPALSTFASNSPRTISPRGQDHTPCKDDSISSSVSELAVAYSRNYNDLNSPVVHCSLENLQRNSCLRNIAGYNTAATVPKRTLNDSIPIRLKDTYNKQRSSNPYMTEAATKQPSVLNTNNNNNSSSKNPNNNRCVRFTMPSLTVDSINGDDDDTTTTSGSYCIDHSDFTDFEENTTPV